MSHGANRGRAAACKDGIDQGTERANRILARLARLAGDVDLNGMNFAQVDGELKVAIDAVHCLANMSLRSGHRQSCDVDRSDLRQVDVALAADAQIGAEVHLAPDSDLQL